MLVIEYPAWASLKVFCYFRVYSVGANTVTLYIPAFTFLARHIGCVFFKAVPAYVVSLVFARCNQRFFAVRAVQNSAAVLAYNKRIESFAGNKKYHTFVV